MIRIEVGTIKSKLVTDNLDLLVVLKQKYERARPGAFYSGAYKNGRWDGKTQFFESNGVFGTGLLNHICKDLEEADLEFTINDTRRERKFKFVKIPGLELRDYQKEIFERFLEKPSCIVKLPTASGKTAIMASMVAAMKDRTGVIFFNKKSLLVQTYEYLQKCGLDVGICFGEGYILKNIMLCTSQSVEKIIHTHKKTSDFIIFDEVHEFCKGKITKAILKSFPNADVRVGFTATMPKESYYKLVLVSSLGPVLDLYSAKELSEDGWLTPPKIQIIRLPQISDPTLDILNLSYQEIYKQKIIENKERNQAIEKIVSFIYSIKSSVKILLLVQSLDHLKKLKELLPEAVTLNGDSSLEERKQAIKEFQKKDKGILIGTVILQTGIDIPEITHFINCRGLKSEIATVQAMGRALRQHQTKDVVYIYDFYDYGSWLEDHSKKRILAYKKLNFEVKIHDLKI